MLHFREGGGRANAEESPSIGSHEVEKNYNGTVTFVTNHGEINVKFTSKDDVLNHTDIDGNKANTGDSGGGTTKAYFQGFSNVKYYNGSDGQIMVYQNEPIKNLFPEGLKGGEKVYAVYLSASSALGLSSRLKGNLVINKNITPIETLYNRMELKNNTTDTNKVEFTYYPSTDENQYNLKFGSSFTLNPFVTAVVRYSPSHYFQPGTAEHYPTTDVDKLADPTNKEYTYVDLHVQLDKRIKLADELDFDLKSYSFQPHMILDKNRNKIAATFEISKDTPNSKVKFNTSGLVDNEFILRTRIRRSENMQENVPLATASSDMELISNKDDNFSISKEEILKIAKKETNPLEINGYIDGWAKLYAYSFYGITLGGPQAIPKTIGKLVSLNFEFNKVSFNKNTSQYNDDSEQDLGTVNVEHNKAIQTDGLKTGTKPSKTEIGDTMPDNPTDITVNNKLYKFKGWNTKEDGTGTMFTDKTAVSEDMTVYAIWGNQINVDFDTQGGTPNKIDRQVLEVDSTASKPKDPTKEGYTFVGWAKKGEDKIFDFATLLKEDTILVAQWKENEYTVSYEFVSATPGKELPSEVKKMTPTSTGGHKNGEKIQAENPKETKVKVENGEWVFKGYDQLEETIHNADAKFVGKWEFNESPTPTPKPQPQPQPKPQSTPDPQPQPDPQPTPDPQPQPELQPAPKPQSMPEQQPTPESQQTSQERKNEILPNTGEKKLSTVLLGVLTLVGSLLLTRKKSMNE